MSDDTPYQPPSAPLGLQPKEAPRVKTLNSMRWALIIIGFASAVRLVNRGRESERELNAAAEEQQQTREAFLDANPDVAAWYQSLRIWAGIGAVWCVAYIMSGILIYTYPVGTTVAALVVYIADAATSTWFDPSYLVRLWIIKLIVIIVLFQGVKIAIAWRKSQAAGGPAADA